MTGDGLLTRWDVPALRAGGGVALVFAIPFSIGASVAGDNDNSGLAVLLTLGAIAGFIVGAGCSAWIQRMETPLAHGIITAAGTYLAAQAVFVIIRLVRGEDVRWLALVFNLTVVVFAGAIGGMLGGRLRASGARPTQGRER